jgi:outer membrane protein assembly factor BamB
MLSAMRIAIAVLAIAALTIGCTGHSGSTGNEPGCDSWQQWGNSASHQGASCVRGQPLDTRLSDMVYDPFVADELADTSGADTRGALFIHYQAPLIDGDGLYMMTKSGTYTPCHAGSDGPSCGDPDEIYRLNSQIWSEQAFAIGANGQLALQWSFDSDWKPEPGVRFEPMFQPALAGALIAIPGAGGALWELDRASGAVVRHVQPFGAAIDPDLYVAGGLAVAHDETIYYNAVKLDHDLPFAREPQAWLVVVSPDGTAQLLDYSAIVRAAPRPIDMCFVTYDQELTPLPLPWPPVDVSGAVMTPRRAPCGSQRPGINTTPAVGPDGTIFVVSAAHFNTRYSYIAAVNGNLTPRWSTSLRDFLHDGCGITTPANGTETSNMNNCRVGTPNGVERVTGLAPTGQVIDDSSSSPVALPDGGVLYGAYSSYNDGRGHLFKLDADGVIVGSYDFGWDSTPAVFGDASSYRIVIKDNHYGKGADGFDHGPFYITELAADLHPIWKFQSTNTRSCARLDDGTKNCDEDHPHGFEWCINAIAVDRDGTVFANSEDGNAYAITADGKYRDATFLELSLGAAYTPVALDHAGRVFTMNNGHLSVLGKK